MTKQITEQNFFQIIKQKVFSSLSFKEKIELINNETRKHIYRIFFHFNTFESMKYEGIDYSIIPDEMNYQEYQSLVKEFCRKQTKQNEWKELFQSPNDFQKEFVNKEWIREWNEVEQRLIDKIHRDVRRIIDPLFKNQNKHLIAMKRILFLIVRANKDLYYIQELSYLFIPIYKLYYEVYKDESIENMNNSYEITKYECLTYRLGCYLYQIVLQHHLLRVGLEYRCCMNFEELMKQCDQELYEHCQQNDFTSMLYAYELLATLFKEFLSNDRLMILLDRIYCSEKLSFSFVFLVSLSMYHRNEMMKVIGTDLFIEFRNYFNFKDDDEFMTILKNAEELYCKYEESGLLKQFIN